MKILQVSADYFKDIYLEESITLLQKGEVICIPTDTLYSVATDPDNQEAVEKLYRIKNRDLDVPLTLIGSCKEEILPYVLDWTPIAEKLSQGLTMILKKSFKVPDYVVSGLDTVGVRIPNHPVILKILEEYGKPLAVSSANLSGNAGSITGRHVAEELSDTELSLILDAGKTPLSEQATIIDLSGDVPVIIREGAITKEAINIDLAKIA
jgi:L-threonylcarbamoyladenylate synthase